MDLGALIGQSATKMKRNWVLIVPPLLTQVVVPFTLLAAIVLVILPLEAAFALTGDFWGLIGTSIGGILAPAIACFLVSNFVTAGWAYMNKRAVLDGQTNFRDLWIGGKKYFLRVLGGQILVGVVMAVPIAAATGAILASILSQIGRFAGPGALAPEIILSRLGLLIFGLLGILIMVGLVELALYIFLLAWMQALVVDNLGILQSIRSSFVFARKNFLTAIGYIVMSGVASIAVSLAISPAWPALSSSQLVDPLAYTNGPLLLGLLIGPGTILNSVVSAVLSAFFMLLLFLVYVDRTRVLPSHSTTEASLATETETRPSSIRGAPRGMKYCVNCGQTIISLAVFCPNCGARQPPLPPQ